MQQWEYKVLQRVADRTGAPGWFDLNESQGESLGAILSQLGRRRWEVVATSGQEQFNEVILRRAVRTDSMSDAASFAGGDTSDTPAMQES